VGVYLQVAGITCDQVFWYSLIIPRAIVFIFVYTQAGPR
jgi:hypothetical protein